MALKLRQAAVTDAAALAPLNALLIRDEGHPNRMTAAELEHRMGAWLKGEYAALIAESRGRIVGYALYRDEPDEVYLRQLFVTREARRQGVGRALVRRVWDHAGGRRRIRIDVLTANRDAQAFWRALGFRDFAVVMQLEEPP